MRNDSLCPKVKSDLRDALCGVQLQLQRRIAFGDVRTDHSRTDDRAETISNTRPISRCNLEPEPKAALVDAAHNISPAPIVRSPPPNMDVTVCAFLFSLGFGAESVVIFGWKSWRSPNDDDGKLLAFLAVQQNLVVYFANDLERDNEFARRLRHNDSPDFSISGRRSMNSEDGRDSVSHVLLPVKKFAD